MVAELGIVIGSVVSLMKAWLNYDVEKRKAQAENKAEPTPSEEAKQGEQVIQTVRDGIENHSENKKTDKSTLDFFLDDPEDYEDALKKRLTKLAENSEPFRQMLQQHANQAQQSGTQMHGEAKASGNARIGMAVGISTGNISYNPGKDNPDKDG